VRVHASDGATELDVRRGDVVVLVAAGGGAEAFVGSVRSVLAHSDTAPILVHGPASSARTVARIAADAGGADRVHFVADPSAAVAAAGAADVALLSAGTVVGPQWLARLRAAADRDASVATASGLGSDLIDGAVARGSVDDAAARVAAAARLSRPRLGAPSDVCVYVRRAAIELIGDPTAPGFAADCLAAGMLHVLADDVLVAGADGRMLSPAAEDMAGPVTRAIGTARRALQPLRVLIDARILAGPLDGTRLHVSELIAAVASTGEAEVSVLVPDRLSEPARSALQRLDGVALVTSDSGGTSAHAARADVVHRPHQISNPADLAVLSALGERLVITHQDLISFHNPAYFPSDHAWRGYRDLTRRALGGADRVLFFSEHVRTDALREELVDPSRADVVRIGVDHALTGASTPSAPSAPPAAADALSGTGEVMLCLGNDYRHKNRVFALRLLDELQRRHAWPGRLVLAGPRVSYGSSRDAEQALLATNPALANAVVGLAEVTDPEREWLLRRAALVLYPTITEGFGLVPYEAAARGVPCLWASGTALSELLPDAAAAIVAWDAAATADRALELMRDDAARARNVAAVREAGAGLSWLQTSRRLVEAYRTVCEQPMNPAAAIERSSGLMSGGLSEDAMRLVGPDGVLPRELERPLLAMFGRPALARAAAAALRVGYRVSRRSGG
jgi:glycosyltransferase involved in cell wall biosynthesis